MVLAEKGDTYDKPGFGFRTEYETSFGRIGAFYLTWGDEETNTRVYSTFKAFPGLFSGIIRYQSRIPTKTDASSDVVARFKTQTSGLYFATSREIDDDRNWQYAVSANYQFDKIRFLKGFGRRGHDNAATVFAFGFGGSYYMTSGPHRLSLWVSTGRVAQRH